MVNECRFPNLFSPGQIGSLVLKNRIIMSAIGTNYRTDLGQISDQHLAFYRERAKGGVAMIIVDSTCVDRRACLFNMPFLDQDQWIPGHARLATTVHEHGAKICAKLFHIGAHGRPWDNYERQPVAPSVRYDPFSKTTTHELTVSEIEDIIEKFASAAERALKAGYDAVELHGAHGYILHEFMSTQFNKRNDEYGGSFANGMRFPQQVIRRIKERTKGLLPVIFKMSAEETLEGGWTVEYAKEIAKSLAAAGTDALLVSYGTSFEYVDGVDKTICPQSLQQGWTIPKVAAIKSVVDIPVIAVSVIREPQFAETILEKGQADFIGMARALLADPEWPKKAAEGRVEDIRRCPGCLLCTHTMFSGQGQRGREFTGHVRCGVNPAASREAEYSELRPATVKKSVMVVGAGPSGMEAATIAVQRGHEVVLYGKGQELGEGQLALCSVAPGKEKMRWVREDLAHQVKKCGVEVHLGTEVDAKLVQEVNPDVVIIAVGPRMLRPDLPGAGSEYVILAQGVLSGKVKVEGERVAVIGADFITCETADFLAERHNTVTLISDVQANSLGRGGGELSTNRIDLLRRLRERVNIKAETQVKEVSATGVTIQDHDGATLFIEADKVVLTPVRAANLTLAEQLESSREVYVIGDARMPRNIPWAIYEGARIGRVI